MLDPSKIDLETAGNLINGLLEKHNSEVLCSRKWDESRKLAYPVDTHKRGLYYLTFFKLDTQKMADLELDFRLNEEILRHQISVVHPKWHDELLAVAQDDQRMGLQIYREDAEGGEGAPPEDFRPGRREVIDDDIPDLN
ncbi:MAG: 30S ribosomal protein S6 [Zavarzinella sp.]